MPDTVKLIVDGTAYSGWQSISVRRSLDEVIASFKLGVVDAWDGRGAPRVRNGAPCQIRCDDALLMSDHIDHVRRHYDGATREVTVSGRSRAADLQDCSYPVSSTLPAQWQRQNVLAIAQALAKPFGVRVTDASGLAAHVVPIAAINPGDTPLDILAAYMRTIGARLVSAANGDLIIVTAGKARLDTPIRLGHNIMSAEDESDLRDRFSDYRIVSQTAASNQLFGPPAASVVGVSHDAAMAALRYRPTIIHAETPLGSPGAASRRAAVARNNAAGRSHRTTYEVHGWRHAAGLWTPNTQVHVTDAECGWDDWLMIGAAELVLDEQGQRTRLTVMPPEAYDAVAVPAKPAAEAF